MVWYLCHLLVVLALNSIGTIDYTWIFLGEQIQLLAKVK